MKRLLIVLLVALPTLAIPESKFAAEAKKCQTYQTLILAQSLNLTLDTKSYCKLAYKTMVSCSHVSTTLLYDYASHMFERGCL
jgi:hypothetical protein